MNGTITAPPVVVRKIGNGNGIAHHLDGRLSKTAMFGKWLYDNTMTNKIPNGKIMSMEKCGRKIFELLEDGNIVQEQKVRGWVSTAKEYTEQYLGCTIWPVAGRGYRCSTEFETAKALTKCVRHTQAWAKRTWRLRAITKQRFIPYVMREVMQSAEKPIKQLTDQRDPFLEQLDISAEKVQSKIVEGKRNGAKHLAETIA